MKLPILSKSTLLDLTLVLKLKVIIKLCINFSRRAKKMWSNARTWSQIWLMRNTLPTQFASERTESLRTSVTANWTHTKRNSWRLHSLNSRRTSPKENNSSSKHILHNPRPGLAIICGNITRVKTMADVALVSDWSAVIGCQKWQLVLSTVIGCLLSIQPIGTLDNRSKSSTLSGKYRCDCPK